MTTVTAIEWEPDILAGFERTTIDLPNDDDGELVATVIRRRTETGSSTCVLYVHGYSDYFFQTHLADSYLEHGIDFYALDRRRCGRSIRPGNRDNYIDDISDYGVEIAEALRIAVEDDGHDTVVLHGHSEGGLVCSIFLADHPEAAVQLLALNSPWLDVNLPGAKRVAWWITKHFGRLFRHKPVDGGLSSYVDSIHSDFRGEWQFDLAWKPRTGTVVYPGWARAVAKAHDRVHSGLGLTLPILVQHADRSSMHEEWDDELLSTDSVLDVEQIHERATALGDDVTVHVISGAMHDLVLSGPTARADMLSQLHTWLGERLAGP